MLEVRIASIYRYSTFINQSDREIWTRCSIEITWQLQIFSQNVVCDIELNLPFSFRSTEASEESYCIFIIKVSYKSYVYAEIKENSVLEKKL